MKINNDHMYHGAALVQIAEHEQFTAINASRYKGCISRSAFVINEKIGIYLKYATKPNSQGEYLFTVTDEQWREILDLKKKKDKVFFVMVCVEAREICCVSWDDLASTLAARTALSVAKEKPAPTSTVLVSLESGSAFRFYTNSPGRKGVRVKEKVVPRRDFPRVLFE